MASLNKCQIIGNLGRDPEMRYMASGDAICNMAVATTESWKDKATGEKKELTEWHRVSIFGKLAEVCGQYLKKGSSVYLEGKLKTRKWTDKDGVEKYTTEIHADTMQMLGGKDAGASSAPSSAPAARTGNGYQPSPTAQQRRSAAPSGGASWDDEIPFRQLGSGRTFHAI